MEKIRDKNGVALVSVIIIVAVIAIMSGALLQTAYLTYSRKLVERRTTETFYTAEAAIDTIKAAVQNSVSSAIPKAGEGEEEFAKAAFSALTGMAIANVTTSSEYTVTGSQLYTFLKNKICYNDDGTAKTDAKYYNGYKSGEATTKIIDGITTNGGAFTIDKVRINSSNEVVIEGVYIKFINNHGYVAEVKTDIVINAPVYAADIHVKTSSYSMFAGNGATVDGSKDGGSLLYIHQEGNMYVGYDKDTNGTTTTSLELVSTSRGQCYYSVGGENAVFNGNIYIKNGNTMIFTGGDGKEAANVQVNGYIYMSGGATLLLAPNVNLMCRGIKADDDEDGKYEDYTGTSVTEQTLSQFYPVSESAISNKCGTEYSVNYNNGDRTAAELLQYAAIKPGDLGGGKMDYRGTNFDPRIQSIVENNSGKCAVYILNANHDHTNGFNNRMSDKYYLATCSNATIWSCVQAGLWNNQITCKPTDSKLNIVPKISYNGEQYDAEFSKIVNIPLVNLYQSSSNGDILSTRYSEYDTDSNTTYSSYSFSKILTKSTYSADISKALCWNNINVTSEFEDPDDAADNPLFGERTYRVPSSINMSAVNASTLTVSTDLTKPGTSDKKSFTAGSSQMGVGAIQGGGVVNVGNGTPLALEVSDNDITVHAAGATFSGVFLSAHKVKYEQSSGYTVGVSLLELAKHTTNNKGIDNDDNDVHKMLKYLAGCKLFANNSGTFVDNTSSTDDIIGLNLFDNIFNGGVSTFWSEDGGKKPSGGGTGDSDGKDFVGNENWEKNPK